jgi:hypothetical protein
MTHSRLPAQAVFSFLRSPWAYLDPCQGLRKGDEGPEKNLNGRRGIVKILSLNSRTGNPPPTTDRDPPGSYIRTPHVSTYRRSLP